MHNQNTNLQGQGQGLHISISEVLSRHYFVVCFDASFLRLAPRWRWSVH